MKILEGKRKLIIDDGTLGVGKFDVLGNANLLYAIALTKGKKKVEVEVNLRGEGASAEVVGLFWGMGKDEYKINIATRHFAPQTSGSTLIKGVLNGEAKCHFKGMIEIGKKAAGSKDMLIQNTLLLSPYVYMESLPYLEINTSKTHARHAVTFSRPVPEQLFYMQTRGIEPKIAEKMVVDGFLQEVLEQMPDLHQIFKN